MLAPVKGRTRTCNILRHFPVTLRLFVTTKNAAYAALMGFSLGLGKRGRMPKTPVQFVSQTTKRGNFPVANRKAGDAPKGKFT